MLDMLRKTPLQGTMFGHQDDTAYGVGWFGEPGRSDVKEVCGDYPAVIGFDLGRIEHGSEKNIDGAPFDLMRREIIAQHRRGGMVAISWHADNPLTGGDAWDAGSGAVASVLPGGERHELFLTWLDRVAAFLNSLTDVNGRKIPVLFRPWHENTGGWFWWGAGHRTDGEYRRLWRMTREELLRFGADHLLWAYSPNADEGFVEGYNSHYPGDDVVDLLGFDSYHFGPATQYGAALRRSLDGLEILGRKHDKPIAITEIGFEGLPQADWWTDVLLPATVDRPLVYILAWRNAHDRQGHFYAPYPGQASAADFIKYYNSPRTLFCRDVNLYK
ncbi:MAG: glycoside hydrolase family 26 protein [Rikenellaceae bacterium]|nr:glycoside hydrolase family 26 protein [Rikenellaceae bacterium]